MRAPLQALARARARCTLYRTVAVLTRWARFGKNSVSFSGRIGERPLRPGRYRGVFSASDEFGSANQEAIRFAIVKG